MKILLLAGTRPEAIKMAPLVFAMRKTRDFEPLLCATGQHREMLAQAFEEFGLIPDIELDVMEPRQTLTGLAGRLLLNLERVLEKEKPDAILVQGDTTTAAAGAMAGFYSSIPVGHVEAGLRSGNMFAPYPEEFNRRLISLGTQWHFAPTEKACDNLLAEGISAEKIFLTGNTVVDALHWQQKQICLNPVNLPGQIEEIVRAGHPYVVITCHRRENFGKGLDNVCKAIRILAARHPDCFFIYPVHLNPVVQDAVNSYLENLDNVLLIAPCGYSQFIRLLDNCLFIMSDSGGVQEEAPALAKKALVMRGTTERPEGVEAGFCRLAGGELDEIVNAAEDFFANPVAPDTDNPYGDGNAAFRITEILKTLLSRQQ